MSRVAIVGPVYPYRAGIAYCTTELAAQLAKGHDLDVISFSRQYPKRFYPGKDDIDETLRPKAPPGARYELDIVNPFTWLMTALRVRRSAPDTIVFVWWIWVWALPYLAIIWLLPRKTRVVLQCHNIGDKEPARWKRALTNLVLRCGDALVVHAKSEADDARKRLGPSANIVTTFLPVHELGGAIPSRSEARARLGIAESRNVALFFGHVRPFKGLDLAMRAWPMLKTDALLLVGGEAWWKTEEYYRVLAKDLALRVADRRDSEPVGADVQVSFDFRFIPDSEIATWFAAADVVLAPYRIEAQSGVALTAFHFARPVIASDVGGLPEVIEEGRNGLLVPAENPAAIAGAVDRFFTSFDRAGGEAAAAECARRYSWEEYGELFRRLVASNPEFRIQNSEFRSGK